MKHSLSHKVNPWQLILSSRGPREAQEFQIKLPRFGDFKFCALKKRLSLKLNISIKVRDNQLLRYVFSKLIEFPFSDVSFNLSLNAYSWVLNRLKVRSFSKNRKST